MIISEQQIKDITIVELKGKLDTANYAVLEKRLFALIEDNVINIILDCRNLDFVSSSGLRILILALKKISALKGNFVLCNLQPNVYKILEIAGFIGIFKIFADVDSALAG